MIPTSLEALAALRSSRITENLWQGPMPPPGGTVARAGFTMLVMCASEFQPPAERYPGVQVIHAPNEDILNLGRERAVTAVHGAQAAAAAIRQGRRVLVTCAAGLNRSGLVSGLTLRLLKDWSPEECIARIQHARPGALGNLVFCHAIRTLRLHVVPPQKGIVLP